MSYSSDFLRRSNRAPVLGAALIVVADAVPALLVKKIAFATVLSLAGPLLGCDRTGGEPLLELSLAYTSPVPDSFPPYRLAVGANGSVALLSLNHPHALVRSDSASEFLEFGAGHLTKPLAVAIADSGKTLEVVDAGVGALFRFPLAGGIDTILTFHERVVAGTHSEGQWYIALREANRNLAIASIKSDSMQILGRIPQGDLNDGEPILLAKGSEALVGMSSTGTARVWFRFEGTAESPRLRTINADVIGEREEQPAMDPLIASVSLVPIGRFFLHTAADVRSDERLLELLDGSGTVIRERRLRAPIGFAGVGPDQRRLYAVRRIDRLELVVYELSSGEGLK